MIDYTKAPPKKMIQAMKDLLKEYEESCHIWGMDCVLCIATKGSPYRDCKKCAYAYYAPGKYRAVARANSSRVAAACAQQLDDKCISPDEPDWHTFRINQLRRWIAKAERGEGGK